MLLWTLRCVYLFKLVFSLFSIYIPRKGITESRDGSTFCLLRVSIMFFAVTLQFTFPPTLYIGSLPTLIVWFFSSLLRLNSNSLWACCSFLLLDLVCPEFRDWIFQFSYSILHLCVMHCSPGLRRYWLCPLPSCHESLAPVITVP